MALCLVPAAFLPDAAVWDYNAEWCAAGETLVPAASDLKGRDVAGWRADVLRMEADPPKGLVPSSLFFLIRESEGRLLGCLDLRRSLGTDWLRRYGGHVGYGVRPSERGKGYAKAMLRLCFPLARERGITRLMVGHEEENAASRAVIHACGGRNPERVILPDSRVKYRYTLDITEKDGEEGRLCRCHPGPCR